MLWFLSIAAKRQFCVDRYCDAAIGVMEKNAEGKRVVSRVFNLALFTHFLVPQSWDDRMPHDVA